MKKIYLLPIAALMAAGIMIAGCHKEDETEPTPNPEPNKEEQKNEPKIQYDSSGVDMLLARSTFTFFNKDNHNPQSGATDCSCFSIPINIAASYKLYDPFEIKVLDTLSYTYRYQVASFSVTDASGENLSTGCSVPESPDVMAYLTHKELKPNTEYTASVTITLAQLVNGEWKQVTHLGNTYDYSCSVKFTTGELPEGNKIDSKFISYQYPIDRQLYYLPEQYKQGYIMLGYSYNNIFNGVSEQDMKLVITSISDENQPKQTTSFTYKECNDVPNEAAEINYSLENITFNPQTIYRFDFLCGEDTIYYMHFATSKFPDMKSKFASILSTGLKTSYTAEYLVMGEAYELQYDEFFDDFELKNEQRTNGNITLSGLVRFEMDFKKSDAFHNSEYEYIYDNYTDVLKNVTQNRIEGYPPSSEFYYVKTYNIKVFLNDFQINHKKIASFTEYTSQITCNFSNIMMDDYSIINKYISEPANEIEQHIKNKLPPWPYLPFGTYKCWFYYLLPGKGTILYKEYFDLDSWSSLR